jgi:Skp family chaperone for outer membrane proteins
VRIWSLLSAFVLGNVLTCSMVNAQQTAGGASAPVTRPTVAVVDVGYILENHPTMKSEIERIEAEMKKADAEFAGKRDSIIKKMDALKEQFTEGTKEYENQEKSIAEMDTTFRLELLKKRKEFDEARAKVIYNVYTGINDVVKYYCDQTGTGLVLRASREKMDPKKPETVQIVMSQEVLYFQPNADITNWVLDALKSRSGQASAPAGGNADPARSAKAPGTSAPPRK